MADPLIPSSGDAAAYIRNLLAGTESFSESAGSGPVYSYYGQETPRAGQPIDRMDYGPSIMAGGGVRQQLGDVLGLPFGASLGVNAYHDPNRRESSISPEVRAMLGHFMLGAGIDHSMYEGGSQSHPRFSAGFNMPVGEGNLLGQASLTPAQQANFLLQLGYPLDERSQIALMLQHSRPYGGTPETKGVLGYTGRF
jgi:hypothetical protein